MNNILKKIIKDITIVVVIYNSKENLFNIINKFNNFKIILVDNGKNQKILKKIEKYNIPNLKIITNNKNVGYGCAVNQAFKILNTKFTLLIEPDCILSEKNLLEMYKTINKYENCAITVPKFFNKKKYKNENVLFYEVDKIKRNEKEKKIFNMISQTEPLGDTCALCFLGALMLFNNKYFYKKIFDERYFIYFEDMQLCKDIYKNKNSIIISSDTSAFHEDHGSTNMNIITKYIIYTNYIRSLYIYLNIKILSSKMVSDMIKFLYKIIINFLKFNKNEVIKNIFYFFGILKYTYFKIFINK